MVLKISTLDLKDSLNLLMEDNIFLTDILFSTIAKI